MTVVVPRLAVSVGIWQVDRVILIRRARPPLAGLWTFPGGHVEPGETVLDAVRREALEETGLVIEPVGEPIVHEIILRGPDGALLSHHVLLVHAARSAPSDRPRAGSDAAELRLVRPDEITALAATNGLDRFVAETRRRLSLTAP